MEKIVPMHIGFIMDGNGRWAKSQGKPRSFGHLSGAENVKRIVKTSFERGIKVVSVYAFSTENWKRPSEEINQLFSLLSIFLSTNESYLIKKEIRVIFSGDISKLPQDLYKKCVEVQEITSHFSDKVFNIALNYGGKQELVRAFNLLCKEGKEEITEEDIENHLYTKGLPDIDLVVRTSGEQRLSNFFLFQSAYSELYFTEKAWPEFDEEELDKAIEWYSQRQRRFGGIENA